MQAPVKIGQPRSLFGTLYDKSAVAQSFRNSKTGAVYDYVVFGGPPVTTVVFAITVDREVLIVKQFRHGAEDFMLELPGGVPQGGETDEENARLELLQETGHVPEKIIRLTPEPIYFDPASWTTAFQPFLAEGCLKIQEQNLDVVEDIEVVRLPLSEWLYLAKGGEMRDAKSIVTTLLAMRVLEDR